MESHVCDPESCACNRRGLESVITVRCRKHYQVMPLNRNESGGGECGACIAEERDAALAAQREAEEKWDGGRAEYRVVWKIVGELGLDRGGCPDARIIEAYTELERDLSAARQRIEEAVKLFYDAQSDKTYLWHERVSAWLAAEAEE